MKATGIVRRVDNLGRIVIPKEIRRTHGIKDGDPLELFVEGDKIIFQKYQTEETWTSDELKEALIAAAKDARKEPVAYLEIVRSEAKS